MNNKLVITLFFLIWCLGLIAQKDSSVAVFIEPSNYKIESDSGFIFRITLRSKEKEDLYVSPRPVIANVGSFFGDIQLRCQKMEDSCFVGLIPTMDDFGIEFDEYTRKVSPSSIVVHKLDIRNFFPIRRGLYRAKVYYFYKKSGRLLNSTSTWVYFFVDTDKYPHPKNRRLFREEN